MFSVGQILRLLVIQRVLVKHGLDELVFTLPPVPAGKGGCNTCCHGNWFGQADGSRQPRGVRIRSVLEELGPIYVKFGQLLSTRRGHVAG